MMKKWLSQYHPKYVWSIVYMLQASEYYIADFFAWYARAQNFTQVEKRKRLRLSAKAVLFLVVGYVALIACYGLAISLLFTLSGAMSYILFVLSVLLTPFVVLCVLVGALVLSFPLQSMLEYIAMQKGRRILAKHPAIRIGIAGSYGKTTMREVLKTVLSAGKKVAAPPSSYNTVLGISKFLQTLNGDEDVLIFEFGEYYAGDIAKLCAFVQPQLGVITGVNEAHLSRFKSVEQTTQTIFELANWLGDKPLFVNGEDRRVADAAPQHAHAYSARGVDDWRVVGASTNLEGTQFGLLDGDTGFQCKTQLIGMHNIGPIAAAFAIGLHLGLSRKQLLEGVNNVRPFEHRLQPRVDNGVTTIDDSYNGNPTGVKAGIEFLKQLSGHRRFFVTPGLVEMGTATQQVHTAIGKQLAEAKIEKVILIRNSVTPFIEAGLREHNFTGDLIWFDDALHAYQSLPNMTVAGDVVLLQNDWPDQYA